MAKKVASGKKNSTKKTQKVEKAEAKEVAVVETATKRKVEEEKPVSECKSVVVKKMSVATTEESLTAFFADAPAKIQIIKRQRKTCSNIGFVHFETVEAAQKALAKDGAELDGTIVQIKERSEEPTNVEPENKKRKLDSKIVSDAECKSVFVKNINMDTTEPEVIAFFKKVGACTVHLLKRSDGRLNGMGWVNFKSSDSVLKALELDGSEFNGRCIQVQRDQNTTVIVKGLPASATQQSLQVFCNDIAPCRVHIVKSNDPKVEKRIAVASFETMEGVRKAYGGEWTFEGAKLQIKPDTKQPVVEKTMLEKAITELQKWAKEQNPEDQMVFEDSSRSMVVQFTLAKMPDRKFPPQLIELPNPLWNDTTEACLIVKSPQRKYKDLLEKNPVPAIKKVIDVTKWQQRYDRFAQKREVCNQFELFIIDDKCLGLVPQICGKYFFTRNKVPVPVRIGSKSVHQVQKALDSTSYQVNGPCIGVKFGRVNFESDKLMENAQAVIEKVVEDFRLSGNSISKISISTSHSPQLPVFVADVSTLDVPRTMAVNHMQAKRDFEGVQWDKVDKDTAAAELFLNEQGECNTVVLKGLSPDATEEKIEVIFAVKPTKVTIFSDKDGKCRGFGYADFETVEGVEAAIEKNGSKVDGVAIGVARIINEEPSDDEAETSEDECMSVSVSNLNQKTTEAALQVFMSKAGKCKAKVLKDKKGKVSGVVHFKTKKGYKQALQMDGQELEGTALFVKKPETFIPNRFRQLQMTEMKKKAKDMGVRIPHQKKKKLNV